jgi:Fe-S cluster assembly iron-binding protein IscA
MSAPHLTEAAAARVAAIATRQGGVPAILRLSVEGGGCAPANKLTSAARKAAPKLRR